jgi:hypothetical protein
MKKRSKKTNAQWYPYEDLGTYFRLEEGILYFCPMSADGIRSDEEVGEVDWYRLDEEDRIRLLTIVQELQQKD